MYVTFEKIRRGRLGMGGGGGVRWVVGGGWGGWGGGGGGGGRFFFFDQVLEGLFHQVSFLCSIYINLQSTL